MAQSNTVACWCADLWCRTNGCRRVQYAPMETAWTTTIVTSDTVTIKVDKPAPKILDVITDAIEPLFNSRSTAESAARALLEKLSSLETASEIMSALGVDATLAAIALGDAYNKGKGNE